MKAFGAGIFILLSQLPLVSFGQTADPLDTWHIRAYYPGSFASVAFGNDAFVAAGEASMLVTSPNGVIWNRVVTPVPLWGPVVFLKHFFITRGGSSGSEVLISTNGLSWFLTGKTLNFDSIAVAPERFVAVNNGGAWISYDGISWTPTIYPYGPNLPLKEVAFGNTIFVATFGESPAGAIVSTDGIGWIYSTSAPVCCSLAFGNGIFLSMSSSRVSSSLDGLNWSATYELPHDPDWGRDYRDVAFGEGRFVAVGIGPPPPGVAVISNVVSSTDGMNWKWHGAATQSGNYYRLNAVTYGQGTFVAVGGNFIIQSSPLTNSTPAQPTLSLNAYAGVRIEGPAGKWYRIERTDALQNSNTYVAVTNIYLPSTPATWIDFDSPNARSRFYRAVVLP
jgi:hypothetical protein